MSISLHLYQKVTGSMKWWLPKHVKVTSRTTKRQTIGVSFMDKILKDN